MVGGVLDVVMSFEVFGLSVVLFFRRSLEGCAVMETPLLHHGYITIKVLILVAVSALLG